MTALDDAKAEIEKYGRHEGSYYHRLLDVCHGDLDAAARLDLAIEGDVFWPDMRKRPFAGNEELKSLYRESQRAQMALRTALYNTVIWARE